MRVFAQWELNQFEAVFNTCMSIALGHDKDRPIQLNQIRHGIPTQESPKAFTLPNAHRHLIIEAGGLEKFAGMFSPINKKESMKWLIGYLNDKRIQPKEFELFGTVWIDHSLSHIQINYEVKQ